ncbi:CDP-glycerol glycerophosphotransferase family protein [Mammaliicoccus lentus]|uniref:CDP-glycerol glycerophosphotransferase family protein n=1 Tax=Mammaliicoccus lentus TaxID=42858 RepID=A0ABS6GZU7_MAMLE|nr:CDP-glycerol glycerophosphotransferase family protein [Mammaliicoccus lentus]
MVKVKSKILNQINRKAKFIVGPIQENWKSPYVRKITRYAYYYKHQRVNENYILYQSRDGKSMTDSPFAIFLYLLNNKKYTNLTHVWVVNSKEKIKEFSALYNKYKNVVFVLKESDKYLKYLTKSKYLINNSTFPAYFTKKEKQIYINTWHGTPLKYMGLDVADNLLGTQNIIKNFLSTDIIVSPNEYTTSIFNKAFRLDGIHNGEIVEIGYPRIDLTLNADINEIKNRLSYQQVFVDEKKVLLYAPTWRGHDVNNPEDSIEKIYETVKSLKNSSDYQVLLKVHPFVYKIALEHKELLPYLIPDSFDTNEILSIVDVLVTDYSSIFFDYLVTDKPIIFYSDDYEEYKNDRGFYISPKDLPGPSAHDLDSLLEYISNIESLRSKYKVNYDKFKEKYVPYEDGKVTEKLANIIFNYKEIKSKRNNKEKILIYPGGLKNNGITTSAINLLENIDYNKYDVTIFLGFTYNAEILKNIEKVNNNVRIILRKGTLLATTAEKYQNTFIKNRGVKTFFEKALYPKKAYQREFRKIFGNSKFDYVIDYSGYSMFWSKILLGTESKKKLIYLHSDILSDMNRTVNNRRPHYQNLKGVVSLYSKFDYLVSVSEETSKINFENLSTANTKCKFTSSMNTINVNKINTLAKDENDFLITKNESYLFVSDSNEIRKFEFNREDFKVMAMGRLSPEKGFDILIKAFKGIVEEHKNAKLYILGEGPLKKSLSNLIKKLKLNDNVYLVGQKSNPFSIMKKCDLFVLSSHYEGQSMVLLEALTLDTNIVASDIPANRYVLKNGEYGMLSENTPEKIQLAISKFMTGNIPEYKKFNSKEYNQKAIDEFYSLLK